ncbi:MAG TPA: hypothetical protein VHZ24_04595 [Pirellulales bacterium]|jgi:Flp pilus assembly protein TadD|nr:hypothetical protein [Pirellulales bacterium]
MASTTRICRWLSAALICNLLASLAVAAPGTAAAPQAVPPPTAAEERIARLVEQLGDQDYFVRQWAQDELARLRLEAFDALSLAENSDDIEVAERARYLIRLLRVDPVVETDPPEVKKILENYESANEQGRTLMAEQLIALADGRGLPALCRLLRFDRSQPVSKLAALKLIEKLPITGDAWPARQATIVGALGRSPRRAAEWLRSWMATHNDPAKAAEVWSKYSTAELQTLQQQPQQSSAQIVIDLLKQQVQALDAEHRDADVLAAMQQMLALNPDDSDTLGQLLTWLCQRHAWPIVEEAVGRYADRFDQEPLLGYMLAQAALENGNDALAQKTADRMAEARHDDPRFHRAMGMELQRRSWFKWSEREYRQSIAIGPADEDEPLWSAWFLGEMLHDQARDADAAAVFEAMCAGYKSRRESGRPFDNAPVNEQSALGQMQLFQGCAAHQHGDLPAEREHLEQGLLHDPMNADILIALYRLPNVDAARRELTLRQIKHAADDFRAKIAQKPDDSQAYNQLAWLIGNTEGDYLEALRASQKSLELEPNNGGFLDTLGRCYYAVGDYESAVKRQTEAVALQPWSGLIRKQLGIFEAALKKSKR